MQRGIIVNNGVAHTRRVWAGVGWLAERGGGTVLIPLWRDFERYFGQKRRPCEQRLAQKGIRVEKMSRHMIPHGNVLVLYPNSEEIAALEDCDRDGDTMAVEWAPTWLDDWRARFNVDEYEVTDE